MNTHSVTLGWYLKQRGFAIAATAFYAKPFDDATNAVWRRFDTHGQFVTADGRNWFMAPTRLRRSPHEVSL